MRPRGTKPGGRAGRWVLKAALTLTLSRGEGTRRMPEPETTCARPPDVAGLVDAAARTSAPLERRLSPRGAGPGRCRLPRRRPGLHLRPRRPSQRRPTRRQGRRAGGGRGGAGLRLGHGGRGRCACWPAWTAGTTSRSPTGSTARRPSSSDRELARFGIDVEPLRRHPARDAPRRPDPPDAAGLRRDPLEPPAPAGRHRGAGRDRPRGRGRPGHRPHVRPPALPAPGAGGRPRHPLGDEADRRPQRPDARAAGRVAASGSTAPRPSRRPSALTGNPFESWLALRGIATLGLRSARACATALELAGRLEAPSRRSGPSIIPACTSHPDHDRAGADRFAADSGRSRRSTSATRGRADAFIRGAAAHPLRPEPRRRLDHPEPSGDDEPSRPDRRAVGPPGDHPRPGPPLVRPGRPRGFVGRPGTASRKAYEVRRSASGPGRRIETRPAGDAVSVRAILSGV